MRAVVRHLFAALVAVAVPAGANAQLIIHKAVGDIEIHADGTVAHTSHVELRANNDAAAQKIAEQPIVYSPSRSAPTRSTRSSCRAPPTLPCSTIRSAR
jgi:hypothetical protein